MSFGLGFLRRFTYFLLLGMKGFLIERLAPVAEAVMEIGAGDFWSFESETDLPDLAEADDFVALVPLAD